MELLEYIKNEGKKDASVQRYKGLGEMNAEQLGRMLSGERVTPEALRHAEQLIKHAAK